MDYLNKDCPRTDCPLHPNGNNNKADIVITDRDSDVCIPALCFSCKNFTPDIKPDLSEILKKSRLKRELRDKGMYHISYDA